MVSVRNVALAAIGMSLAVSLAGCGKDWAVTWQADAGSSDGHYQAHAETIQQSGPGNAALWTEVRLTQKGRVEGSTILVLMHNNSPQDVRNAVRMTWVGDSKLRVEYTASSDVAFQAVKAAGVEIESRAFR